MNDDINYLNMTVWATIRPSHIHGVGVFAIRDIPKDTQITDYSVHDRHTKTLRIRDVNFRFILPEIQSLILDRMLFVEDQSVLEFCSPNAEVCLRSFMNHAETPNTDGFKTLRDIKKGEELTENFKQVMSGARMHRLVLDHYKTWMK